MESDCLKEVISEILNVDINEISEETTFLSDLGADSLDVFQIIMGVEERLNIEIDPDEVEKIITVGEAVELIRKYTE
ncbi:MAG: acyl carrier protein [Lachnospiraceae bacterium]|nr:acyl carrier protein [Lachnospiraceae bacterium]